LTDFGISSLTLNEISVTKLGPERNIGEIPIYMAPEQIKDKCY
jgi:hypothetical protein